MCIEEKQVFLSPTHDPSGRLWEFRTKPLGIEAMMRNTLKHKLRIPHEQSKNVRKIKGILGEEWFVPSGVINRVMVFSDSPVRNVHT